MSINKVSTLKYHCPANADYARIAEYVARKFPFALVSIRIKECGHSLITLSVLHSASVGIALGIERNFNAGVVTRARRIWD